MVLREKDNNVSLKAIGISKSMSRHVIVDTRTTPWIYLPKFSQISNGR